MTMSPVSPSRIRGTRQKDPRALPDKVVLWGRKGLRRARQRQGTRRELGGTHTVVRLVPDAGRVDGGTDTKLDAPSTALGARRRCLCPPWAEAGPAQPHTQNPDHSHTETPKEEKTDLNHDQKHEANFPKQGRLTAAHGGAFMVWWGMPFIKGGESIRGRDRSSQVPCTGHLLTVHIRTDEGHEEGRRGSSKDTEAQLPFTSPRRGKIPTGVQIQPLGVTSWKCLSLKVGVGSRTGKGWSDRPEPIPASWGFPEGEEEDGHEGGRHPGNSHATTTSWGPQGSQTNPPWEQPQEPWERAVRDRRSQDDTHSPESFRDRRGLSEAIRGREAQGLKSLPRSLGRGSCTSLGTLEGRHAPPIKSTIPQALIPSSPPRRALLKRESLDNKREVEWAGLGPTVPVCFKLYTPPALLPAVTSHRRERQRRTSAHSLGSICPEHPLTNRTELNRHKGRKPRAGTGRPSRAEDRGGCAEAAPGDCRGLRARAGRGYGQNSLTFVSSDLRCHYWHFLQEERRAQPQPPSPPAGLRLVYSLRQRGSFCPGTSENSHHVAGSRGRTVPQASPSPPSEHRPEVERTAAQSSRATGARRGRAATCLPGRNAAPDHGAGRGHDPPTCLTRPSAASDCGTGGGVTRLPTGVGRVHDLLADSHWEQHRRGRQQRASENSKLRKPLWKTVWRLLRRLGIDLPCDPGIPLLGIYPEGSQLQNNTCTPMFTAALFTIAKTWKQPKSALFTIAKTWKQPKCPSTDDWIKKLWYTYTMEYYQAIKKDKIMSFAATRMHLEIIILSEEVGESEGGTEAREGIGNFPEGMVPRALLVSVTEQGRGPLGHILSWGAWGALALVLLGRQAYLPGLEKPRQEGRATSAVGLGFCTQLGKGVLSLPNSSALTCPQSTCPHHIKYGPWSQRPGEWGNSWDNLLHPFLQGPGASPWPPPNPGKLPAFICASQ
ncbi:LINE-1 retrotransposable element ORF2 protein [Camelus dromedarius]|uniref:LINE-1 retrotransposable element ORF2 protein n=1 Tax=Camelus dromedarius TaxID=9838 RepID=A0A5N4DHK1_CAMDR|nr:LINE-1 retrotransposable element ORF2 protein [Camelus dromedarius]